MTSRVVLVTGARGGLGRTVTAAVQVRGWTAVGVGRPPSAAPGPWSSLPASPTDSESGPRSPPPAASEAPNLPWISADVGTPEGARAAVAECVARYGVPTGLVNCAGEVLVAPLHRTAEAQYRACLRANLDTAFFTLAAWVDALRAAQQPGAAVLVSSVAARIGIQNHEAVAAAKGAVEALVRSAAATYASARLRVNGVAPGLMDTPATAGFLRSDAGRRAMAAQYPLGRYGGAEDVAATIAWLLGDESSWITGQIVGVDGGYTAVRPLVKPA